MSAPITSSLSGTPLFLRYNRKIAGLNPTQHFAHQENPPCKRSELLALQSHYEVVKTHSDVLQ